MNEATFLKSSSQVLKPMEIVAIGKDDWESLRDIRMTSLRDSPDAFGISYEEAKRFSAERWRSIASDEHGLKFFLARCNGENVGLIGGVYADGAYELVSMWVAPGNRRRGVGSSLVEALLRHAQCEGISSVLLEVSSTNTAACNLYLKFGFKALKRADTSDHNSALRKMVWHAAAEPRQHTRRGA